MFRPNTCCGVCGERQRSLVLDTVTQTLTGFCCVGKASAPPLVVSEPVSWNLTEADTQWLRQLKIKP